MAQFRDVFLFFVISLHIAVTLIVFTEVDKTQSSPYMDEIFHIPQAQKYCNGSFSEWDPMITTLPGLYLSSVGLLKPLSSLLQVDLVSLCSVTVLRSINVLFSMGCLFAIYHILRTIHAPMTKTDEIKTILTAVSLASFPLLYFYVFLYYTDEGSTFFVLLAYYFCLRGNHLMAAILAGDAILFRQTNIVWVIFMVGITVGKQVNMDTIPQPSNSIIQAVISAIWRSLQYVLSISNIINLVSQLWSYVVVIIAFFVFLYWNEGIVVGAHTSHEATTNFPQLFYFAAFTAGFSLPHALSFDKLIRFLKGFLNYPFTYLATLVAMFLLVHFFTYVHPYILADNRHIVFYVWHRIFMRHEYVKYILVPGYLFAGWTIRDSISHKSELWQIVYFVCLLVATVPQQLLEFRYFIIPYLIYRVNSPIKSYVHIITEFTIFSLVNVIILYLFLQKPFYWPDSTDEQRFMW